MTNSTLSVANLNEWIGKEVGVSDWILVDQERINAFAQCTGDHQWIHVDVERARRESPYGGPIAHGFLTLSLLADMGSNIGVIPKDVVAAFNYGLDKVRFLAPVKAGARVRARVMLTEVTEQAGGRKLIKLSNTVEIEGETKPALIAETLAVLVAPQI
jgi:acyl dehydratase